MDVLQWSRHYRLFPGQGAFDLPGVPRPRAGRRLHRAAVAGGLQRRLPAGRPAPGGGRRPPVAAGAGRAHAGPAADRRQGPRRRDGAAAAAAAAGCRVHRARGRRRQRPAGGRHPGGPRLPPRRSRTGPSRCSSGSRAAPGCCSTRAVRHRHGRRRGTACGSGRVGHRPGDRRPAAGRPRVRRPARAAAGPQPRPGRGRPVRGRRAGRHRDLLLPRRRRRPERLALGLPAATGRRAVDRPRLRAGGTRRSRGITHIDHIALTQPFDRFDEAALFYRSVLGLQPQHSSEVAAPFGLVRNRAVADPDRAVRICLSVSVLRRGSGWQPGVTDPQHVAFATDDASRPPEPPARPAPPSCRSRTTTTTTWTPGSGRRRPSSAPCASSVCCSTGTPAGEFLHFYTDVSAAGSSSRWCSGSAATPATGRSTRRSGWPRTAASGTPSG